MNGNQQHDQQPKEHPPQPIEVQPDGTWILGRGADRWIPSKNQIGDLRWVVERDLRKELGVPPKTALNKDKIEFHKRQLALLDLAKQAPRCEHVFSDGRCCKAPRVKKGKLCYAHTLMEEKRPQGWNLPPLEDPNDVMLWLMDALRGLLEGRISEKTAGLMFYGLQLAMANSRFTTFRDVKFEEMVRTAPKSRRDRRNRASSPESERALPQRALRNTEEEPSEDSTAKGAKAAKEDGQRAVTAEFAKNAEEGTALPQRAQGDRRNRASSPTSPESEGKDQPLSLQRADEQGQDRDEPTQGEGSLQPQNSEVNPGLPPQHAKTPRAGDPGVESAKSLFSGVEVGEGVADNGSVSSPVEPPRKGSQSEILMIPKDVELYIRR
jgi:hypothetical protein